MACAASPMMTWPPMPGRYGREVVGGPTGELSRGGPDDLDGRRVVPANRSISIPLHCSVAVAASSSPVGSSARGGLANHQTSPDG